MRRAAALAVAVLAATAITAEAARQHRLLGAIPVGGATAAPAHLDTKPGCFGPNLCYFGGQVLHGASAHVVYWAGASGFDFSPSYVQAIDGFLGNLVAATGRVDTVYAVNGQYTDPSGPALDAFGFGGSAIDHRPYPSNGGTGFQCNDQIPGQSSPGPCITDDAVIAELRTVAARQGWALGPRNVYFLLTPPGVGVCATTSTTSCAYQSSGFCAYHSNDGSGVNDLIYGVIPYADVPGCRPGGQHPNGGDADPSINTLSHEHNEMITDPDGDAWELSDGRENGDLCRTTFSPPLGGPSGAQYNQVIGTGHYELQSEWSNLSGGCAAALGDNPPVPGFTVPAQQQADQPLALSAAQTTGAVISYGWHFDDGSPDATGAAVTHTFTTPGRHAIVLTVVDHFGVPASVSQTTTVIDEAPVAAFHVRRPRRGSSFAFDADPSSDPDGRIVRYHWAFGDGHSGTGARIHHAYRSRARHAVTLTITDSAGLTASATRLLAALPRR